MKVSSYCLRIRTVPEFCHKILYLLFCDKLQSSYRANCKFFSDSSLRGIFFYLLLARHRMTFLNGVLLSRPPSHAYTPSSTSTHGKLYTGYPHVARMCFKYIDCLELSKVSGSEVSTFTAVIIKREFEFPFDFNLL